MRGVLTWCLLSLSLVSSQKIELRNNGYENILISISDSVPYNENLLFWIKEIFNEASRTLFKATGFRVYFRSGTILVPTSWNVSEAQVATTEFFGEGNIQIDSSGTPRVKRGGDCGVPGVSMHLSHKLFLDETDSWGPPDKVVVHEWGHLRWGLYNEYPDSKDDITEHFYRSPTTDTIEASRCNINIQGTRKHRITKELCEEDAATSLYEPDCRYFPDKDQTQATSSFMCYQHLPSVSTFCDDDELGALSVHNYESSSPHNKHCEGKSSWAVMRGTEDFIGGKNSAVDSSMNTDVAFNVVQRHESRVVIVMDVSGSMATNDFYIKLNAAARRYLLYTVPTGVSVGLVKYSSSATKLTSGLRKINSAVDRDSLANLVPLQSNGGTAIGQGLLAAKQLLEANGGETKGGRIILLTDGEETNAPFVADVQPQIRAAGITVDTILLSEAASTVLISLAANTGGFSFYSSGDSLSTSLNDAFTTAERVRINNPRKVPITIESRVVTVLKLNETCYNVMVDNGLGLDTTFTFSWVSIGSLRISLTDSNNVTNIAKVEGRAAAYQCPGECATGEWMVCINNPTDADVNVIVQVESTTGMIRSMNSSANKNTSGSTDDEDPEDLLPVTVQTIIANEEPDFNKIDAKPVSLFATVNRGYSPVIGAKVVASIEYPNSAAKTTKEMRDDGAGADIFKDDGTYSAYIINSETTGKHTVSVKVISTNGTNVKKLTMVNSAWIISEPGGPISTQEVKLVPTDEFQRYSLAGFISVRSIAPPDRDFLAPSRIKDLKVTKAKYEESRFTLEWTAVGDDLDSGNASSYELWKADNHKILYKAPENATQVNDTDVVTGELSSPLPAHSRERLVINIPDRDKISVYAIVAKDEAGNSSPLSNIVSVKLVYVPPATTTTTTPTTTTTAPTTTITTTPTTATTTTTTPTTTSILSAAPFMLHTGAKVGIALGSAILLIIILVAVILVYKRTRTASTENDIV